MGLILSWPRQPAVAASMAPKAPNEGGEAGRGGGGKRRVSSILSWPRQPRCLPHRCYRGRLGSVGPRHHVPACMQSDDDKQNVC